jgi:putative heme-binding domain-containing protein
MRAKGGRSPAAAITLVLVSCAVAAATARADAPLPHHQDRPPGDPLSPAEAIGKMTVPPGFRVEVVAAEPDIVNPVAMTFDERGRAWITESLEYPRKPAGPGRDRVKVVEDTDGDGKADKFTVFADGLNIPSGIAVGHGGVWVANAPDILFLQDTDGDGKADRREVVVTGFGRSDTHELPNSLTWGPDGWLYGWNGVFNPSRVAHRGRTFDFTCAIFRIHPRTRAFELFCEGTSNPWGIAFDPDGSTFASACVIDHLWHLVETGYYHRQGGPYPPFTWKIGSIVDHAHQKAAYCGIHYFDSPAYPPEYRDRLYMGNIHGNCINVDTIARNGSTYRASAAPDFLTANDAWFMPVAQKTGPDGCLYILDWYDRYHCYQDANRDPAGIDRLKGRLYRVRYQDAPRRAGFDLAKETDEALIRLLASPNVYDRDVAQRLLTERLLDNPVKPAEPGLSGRRIALAPGGKTRQGLRALVLDAKQPRKARMHALWALVGGGAVGDDFLHALMDDPDDAFRAWGVRAAGNLRRGLDSVRLDRMARDPSPDVRLQAAIAARKVEGVDPMPALLSAMARSGDDPLIPHVVWQNLHPLLEDRAGAFAELVARLDPQEAAGVSAILPRAIERILARRDPDPAPAVRLVTLLAGGPPAAVGAARAALEALSAKVQTGEIAGPRLEALREGLRPLVRTALDDPSRSPLRFEAVVLATSWKDPEATRAAREVFRSPEAEPSRRLQALGALAAAGDREVLDAVAEALVDRRDGSSAFRGQLLAALGKLDDPRVAAVVLEGYPRLEPELRPRAIELLTQRPAWGLALIDAIGRDAVPADALNVNHVRKLLGSRDAELVRRVKARWGAVREGRNPQREQVIARMRAFLRANPGDPSAGRIVFANLCGQCHKIYGQGQDVGPDLTSNGRASFEQLLSNVFDPSLVIGPAYQATTVATADGRVLTGLLAEDNPQRIVLKTQGGKLETIPRDDVDELKVSPLSLMPEDVEKQLKPQELADLFAFLTLDRPPDDPQARPLPGTREVATRQATDPSQFAAILDAFAPGFSTKAVGEGGLALLSDYLGRPGVLRTHPVDRDTPCVLHAKVRVPAGKSPRLVLSVAHDPRGDWELAVKLNDQTVRQAIIGPDTARDGWAEIVVDLSSYAGQDVDLKLLNRATGWNWEHGYWGRIEIIGQ